MPRLEIVPNQAQQIFIDCDAPEQSLGGAKQGGKTVGAVQKMLLLLTLFPGNRGLAMRSTLELVRDTTIYEFLKLAPPGLILAHNRSEHRILIHTGEKTPPSELLYRGVGDLALDPAMRKTSKGLILGFLLVEEANEVPLEVVEMLVAQMTLVLPDGTRPPYMAMYTSNPEPGWPKQRFFGIPSKNQPPVPGCVYIRALPRENTDPRTGESNLPPGWETQQRASHDPEWVRKYLDANWDVAEGMVFEEFDRQIHCIEDFDITGIQLGEALDHAATGVTCHLGIGKDPDENVFMLDEYYQENRLVSAHSREIHQRRNALMRRAQPNQKYPPAPFAISLCDPHLAAKDQVGGQSPDGRKPAKLHSVLDLYIGEGLPFSPAWNAVEAGIERMKEYIHVNPLHRHPFTGQLGAPRLYIVGKRCPNLVREIIELRKDISSTGQVRYIGSDHALDCVRYYLNAQMAPPERSKTDWAKMLPQEVHAVRAHQKWVEKFGKTRQDAGIYP